MAKLRLENIEKKFENGHLVLENINLSIEEGEFYALLGPSGCSKSTLLRVIAGLTKIDSGEIYLDNENINELSPQKRKVSMVFQNYSLYPHLSVFENLAFPLRLRKEKMSKIISKVTNVLDILDLSKKHKNLPKELSGGEKQRVAIGRSLVKKTDIFLFDEPLSNIDVKLRNQLKHEISRLHKELNEKSKKSIFIYVTHDQSEAISLADKICVMNFGKIMQIGTPKEIYDYPQNKFVASFVGMPQMNIKKAEIVYENDSYYVKLFKFKLSISENKKENISKYLNEKIWFGIRSEDLIINNEEKKNNVIKGTVKLIEPLGYETFVYFSVEDSLFVTRLTGEAPSKFKYGIELEFLVNMEKAHIFEFFTEKNISL